MHRSLLLVGLVAAALASAAADVRRSGGAGTARCQQGVRRGRHRRQAAAEQRGRASEEQARRRSWQSAPRRRPCSALTATAARCWSGSWSAPSRGSTFEIINRGFSGELAEAAGERIKIEVALNEPDIVLWQVGTNDAFAQVSVDSFEQSVAGTVRWLKEHNVDVILIGLHYAKQLAKDPHYQAIRNSLGASPSRRTCCASVATRPWRCWRARWGPATGRCWRTSA